MNLKGKNIESFVLLSVVFLIALYQVLFAVFLPDSDSDAYAHFIIARDVVRNPYNLSLHWVWLPLFHYVGAFFVFIGSEMQSIRYLNIIVTNITPFVLFFYLKKKEPQSNIPITASLIFALFPISILMGTTAQPEPMFALLLLLFVVSYDSGRYFLSSLFLTLSCVLRYEAWAVLAGVAIYFLLLIYRNKSSRIAPCGKSFRIYLNVLLPAIAIFTWSVLRFESDGAWFTFLHGTQKFANDALGKSNSFQGGILNLFIDIFHYPVWLPFLLSGILILFIPFGFKRFLKNNKILFVIGISILMFVTVSWVMKANLGLNRHFTSIVPFYAVMISYGIFSVKDYLKKYSHFLSEKLLPALIILIYISYVFMWMYIWQDKNRNLYSDKKEPIEYLKNLYITEPNIQFLNNDPVIEVLSGINYKAFNHFWMGENQETAEYIRNLMNSSGNTYIITKEKYKKFMLNFGDVVYQTDVNQKNPESMVIMKIRNKTG